MNALLRHISTRLDALFTSLDQYDLIPNPIKRLSRRLLALAVVLSAALHIGIIGGFWFYRLLSEPKADTLTLIPYPIDLINPVITSEEGGGGGGEPPPEFPNGMLNDVNPVSVAIGLPEVLPDVEIADEAEVSQDVKEVAMTTEAPGSASEEIGKGTGGAGTGEGAGVGAGQGAGSGGSGPPGTFRYDTPPNPRRLITAVQPKKLRNLEGMVKFRLLISEFGAVIEATIVESSGNKELDELAIEAIQKSSFNPAMFQTRPVKAWINFGYGFRSSKK